jgi:hypothetical protein
VITTIDIAALNAHLDLFPGDQGARLALADAMMEVGDERGLGVRALAGIGFVAVRFGKWHYLGRSDNPFYHRGSESPMDNLLPLDWYRRVRGQGDRNGLFGGCWREGESREGLELDAASAFLRLPPDRQQQILAGEALQ